MSRKHLSLSPRNLLVKRGGCDSWRYEDPRAMIVMVTARKETAEIHIPVKLMRDYLKRLDRR